MYPLLIFLVSLTVIKYTKKYSAASDPGWSSSKIFQRSKVLKTMHRARLGKVSVCREWYRGPVCAVLGDENVFTSCKSSLQRCLGQRSWHKSVVLGNSVARRCRYDSLEKEVLLGCGGTSMW